MTYTLHHGDCLEVLRTMPDNSVDSIVTDPPYGLSDHKPADVVACLTAWLAGELYMSGKRGFMGKTWDSWVPGPEVWRECLRVLKPGGHVLAFAGSRTHDLMSMAMRLAGFECRDTVMYVYGSGFPKSLDVSKQIDKAAGAEREVIGTRKSDGGRTSQPNTEGIDAGALIDITAPATESARQWQGWGTALKPAFEPVLMFRKPLSEGTVAANVLQHGTGALNIDGCRVATDDGENRARPPRTPNEILGGGKGTNLTASEHNNTGRWPANLILSDDPEVVAAFPQAKGQQGALTGSEPSSKTANTFGEFAGRASSEPRGDTGSAARFFYCAKASRKDRDEGLEGFVKTSGGFVSNTSGQHMTRRDDGYQVAPRANTHMCVKPTELMRYLCRLVTPPGGVVLDPFMGSGSTGKAAMLEGFRFVGCELSAEYLEIARARIEAAAKASNA